MTEPLAPLTDEDLSAVLDGEADASITARVAADPEASARLAQLRAAGEALRSSTVTPLAPSIVDGLIGRALSAADEVPTTAAGPDQPSDHAVVQPMVAPTRRRTGSMPPWLVAAAVVLLVGVGLVLVWSGRDDGSNEQDTAAVNTEQADKAADSASGSANGGGSVAGEAPADAPSASPHGEPTTTAAADSSRATALVQLGTFADADALREDLKEAFPRPESSKGPDDGDLEALGLSQASISRCDTQVRTILSIEGQARNEGVATVDGKQVLVYEYDATGTDGRATTLVAAVYPAACDQVLTFYR
ncbi:hypothetical protein BH10ACT1_BH10ACT1_40530 [soil metagenome]